MLIAQNRETVSVDTLNGYNSFVLAICVLTFASPLNAATVVRACEAGAQSATAVGFPAKLQNI